jgi:hypothetical protein
MIDNLSDDIDDLLNDIDDDIENDEFYQNYAKSRLEMARIYANKEELDILLANTIETFLRETKYEYVLIGGRAVMFYLNLDKITNLDTLDYITSFDYDLYVPNEQIRDNFINDIKNFLNTKIKELKFNMEYNESFNIKRLGYEYLNGTQYFLDIHVHKPLIEYNRINNINYAKLSWLLDELCKYGSTGCMSKDTKRKVRLDTLDFALNHINNFNEAYIKYLCTNSRINTNINKKINTSQLMKKCQEYK